MEQLLMCKPLVRGIETLIKLHMFERYWELKLFLESESVSNYTMLTYYDQVVVEVKQFENQVSGKCLVTIEKQRKIF